MPSPSRKLVKRRNHTEHFEYIKPLCNEDLDKEVLLFHEDDHDYRPEYLEMPIQIQGDLRLKSPKRPGARQQSSESSENVGDDGMFEEVGLKNPVNQSSKEAIKDEYDQLMDPHYKMDVVDSLLMPFYEGHSLIPNGLMFDEMEVKQEGHSPSYELLEESRERKSELRMVQDEKKNLLGLVNNFRAFTQATNMVVNFHKLAKKDTLNKVYTSVFNVLTKESRKLQLQLENQQSRVSTVIEIEKRKELFKSSSRKKQVEKGGLFGMSKELASTSAGCEQQAKIEQKQGPNKKE